MKIQSTNITYTFPNKTRIYKTSSNKMTNYNANLTTTNICLPFTSDTNKNISSNYSEFLFGRFISFGRKKKNKLQIKERQIGEYKQSELIRRFAKNGCSKQDIEDLFKSAANRQRLEQYITAKQNKEIIYPREPQDRELVLSINAGLTPEDIKRVIEISDAKKNGKQILTEKLNTKKAIYCVQENLDNKTIQRTIDTLKRVNSEEEKPFFTFKQAVETSKKGFNDKQVDTYLKLRAEEPIKHYKTNFFDFVENPKTYNKFIELTSDKNQYGHKLSTQAALYIIENEYDDETVKKYTDYRYREDENGQEKEYNKFDEILLLKAVQKGLSYRGAICAIQIKESFLDFSYDNFKDEAFIDRFEYYTKTNKGTKGNFSTPLNGHDAYMLAKNKKLYNDKNIQKFINLTNKHTYVPFVIKILNWFEEHSHLENIKNVDNLPKKDIRNIMKAITQSSSYFMSGRYPYEDFPIFPRTQEEYCEKLDYLANIIGLSTNPLTDKEKEKFIQGIDTLPEHIKNIDFEGNKKTQILKDDVENILIGLEKASDIKESLKLIQNIAEDKNFKNLTKTDKRVLLLSALLLNTDKYENAEDKAFDAFYTIQRFDLTEEEQKKIYNIIKSSDFTKEANNAENEPELYQIYRNTAFDTRYRNTFNLLEIFIKAQAKNKNSDIENINTHLIKTKILNKKIKSTEIIIPQTKIPAASEIKNAEEYEADGIKNTVLKIKKCDEDLSKYGFEKGATKYNFRIIMHGLDFSNQVANFNEFAIVDTDAVLSTSYADIKNYRVFRKQGLILETDFEDIHAGYYRDFGSGMKKNINGIKNNYIFGSSNNKMRVYIPNLIKEQMGLNNDEYIERISKIYGCKSITDIKKIDKELACTLEEIYETMEAGKRKYGRQYNEFLISNPEVKAIFSYDTDYNDIPLFLRKYAAEKNLPIIMF